MTGSTLVASCRVCSIACAQHRCTPAVAAHMLCCLTPYHIQGLPHPNETLQFYGIGGRPGTVTMSAQSCRMMQAIARELPGRTPQQATQVWRNNNPARKTGRWTEEEDQGLRRVCPCLRHHQILSSNALPEAWTLIMLEGYDCMHLRSIMCGTTWPALCCQAWLYAALRSATKSPAAMAPWYRAHTCLTTTVSCAFLHSSL